MLGKLKTHRYPQYFAFYSLIYFGYGIHMICLGPYIPYLSVQTGIIQTEYSFLFSCRSFGMALGSLLVKMLQQKKSNHELLTFGSIGIFVFSTLFCLSIEEFWLGLWLFMVSVTYPFVEIPIMVSTITITNPKEIEFWMLLNHSIFGVGGLMGPFFIYLFQTWSYLVFGLLFLSFVPLYCKYRTPQQLSISYKTQQKKQAQPVSRILQISLCFLSFLNVGLQCIYAGWISSFAVLTDVTNNKGATVFVSIFWIVTTVARFVLAFAPGSSSDKMKYLLMGNVCSGIITLALIDLGHTELACWISSVLFGLSMSLLYPLVFSLSLERGLILKDSQSADIVLAGVLAEGILAMFVGVLMQWIHVNVFFYALIFIALLMLLNRYWSILLIQKQVNQHNTNTELQPLLK